MTSERGEQGAMRDKKALVTGGTRGIGFAIAECLRDRGAVVSVTGTKPNGQGPEGCEYLTADFSAVESSEAFAASIQSTGFDILINNAGININSPFAEIESADFLKVQQINVTAPMQLCRAVIPIMRTRGWGRIVNISSIWGIIARETRGPYAASKFALDGMTAALSAEVASDGILANCVAPGFIETDLTRRVLGEEGIKKVTQELPIGRLGQPEEIAALVAWLAGPENTYITGQNIAIDGGFTRV